MNFKTLAAAAAMSMAVSAVLAGPASAHRGVRDADHDHMADAWELAHGLDPANRADRKLDLDGDGLRNDKEFRFGTDPADEDSDDDGIDDGDERRRRGRGRLPGADANRNGIVDGDEDRDHDGLANEDEDDRKEPCGLAEDDDSDADGLDDEDENELGTDPASPDSDEDGVEDGNE
ncbi:MAG: hypothetical protein H0U26_04435, partial [Acidimicrobiia bacterium]|nr:hypothetical protein [Acidimicrobiia bacterium]